MTIDKPGNSNSSGSGSNIGEQKMTIVQPTQMPEFSPNVSPWNEWKERLEIHFCEIDATGEGIKKTTLLKSIGNEAYSLLRALCDPKLPTEKTYQELCGILEQHYMPPVIIFRERQNFYSATKNSDESVTNWYARVKHLALKCKFNNLDEAVRDKFIVGLSMEEKMFEKLCEEDEKLTLADALKKALIHESKLKGKTMSQEVNFIRGKVKHDKRTPANNGTSNSKGNGGQSKREDCKHCGWRSHKSSMCKYKEATCNACGKKGHLAPISILLIHIQLIRIIQIFLIKILIQILRLSLKQHILRVRRHEATVDCLYSIFITAQHPILSG